MSSGEKSGERGRIFEVLRENHESLDTATEGNIKGYRTWKNYRTELRVHPKLESTNI